MLRVECTELKTAVRTHGVSENQSFAYMGLIPLPEWGGIDLDDGALDEGVCSDEFVVGGVVDLIRYLRL